MKILIEKTTGKILDTAAETFPVHESFEWIDPPVGVEIDNTKIGWKLTGNSLEAPPPPPERVDPVAELNNRVKNLESKNKVA